MAQNTQPQTNAVVIDQVVCINIDAAIWSGRKKLTPSDFRIGDGELPPADLASLGSKKICNPDSLRAFDTLKKEAQREAGKVGVRFLGGYAVPMNKAQELCARLDDISVRFKDARTKFISEYDNEINDWISKHPGWESSIRDAVPQAGYVESRISFDYQAFEVKATGISSKGLDRAVGGLADQLYHEISREAFDYYDISLVGKPYGTQKTLRPLRSIRSKLDGLSFLDQKVSPIIELIDHVLSSLPTSGRIEGPDMVKLCGIVHILSDKDRLVNYGERMLNGSTAEDLLDPHEEVNLALDVADEDVLTIPAAEAPVVSIPFSGDVMAALLGSTPVEVQPENVPAISSPSDNGGNQLLTTEGSTVNDDASVNSKEVDTAKPAPTFILEQDNVVSGSLFI